MTKGKHVNSWNSLEKASLIISIVVTVVVVCTMWWVMSAIGMTFPIFILIMAGCYGFAAVLVWLDNRFFNGHRRHHAKHRLSRL